MTTSGDARPVSLAADDAVELAELLDDLLNMIKRDWSYQLETVIESQYGHAYDIVAFRADVLACRLVLEKAMK